MSLKLMRLHTVIPLLLLLSTAATAQELDTALSAVVRISGLRDGTTVRGSGFVVGLDRGKATIVTASHVIEGVQQLAVTFGVALAESFPAGAVLGMDAGSLNGLAAIEVRGALPTGLTTLSFEVESRPRLGEALFLLGFPQMDLAPRTIQRVLSARRGTLLLIDQGVGEGFSGGPVLQDGKVVGVVTDTDDQTTYAVTSVVAREALEGWEVKLGEHKSSPELSGAKSAQGVVKCVHGEELTANGIVFVRICPGTFTMGSAENDPLAFEDEKPAHQVTLSEFWLGKTEISNTQYQLFRSNHQGVVGRLPATGVSWDDAKAACEHFGGRLPTEAEWEYAARAGKQTAWSIDGDENLVGDYAWYDKNSSKKPHPVGTKEPNAWGLHDMHGNVWEWVADWHGTYPGMAQINPSGPAAGQDRVLRGGSFIDSARFLRSAFRDWVKPESQSRLIGFRCARGLRRQP